MIQTNIEQAVAEFIARSYIAAGVATGTVAAKGTTLTFTGALAGQDPLRIHAGEITEDAVLPLLIVAAGASEEDDCGNHTIDIALTLIYPTDADDVTTDPLGRLDTEFQRVFSFAADDDIGAQMAALNTLTTDASIIGVETRGSRRDFEEHRAIRELTIKAYCCDVALY